MSMQLVDSISGNDLALATLVGLRIRLGLTKQQMAAAMGRSLASVKRVETGDPMLSEVFDYATVLGMYPSAHMTAPYLRFEAKSLDERRDELMRELGSRAGEVGQAVDDAIREANR